MGKQVKAKEAILDGEIVALDRDGRPRFQLLQPRVGRKHQGDVEALVGRSQIVYYAFDLLYIDGYDLTACSVVERKAALEKILRPASFIAPICHATAQSVHWWVGSGSLLIAIVLV